MISDIVIAVRRSKDHQQFEFSMEPALTTFGDRTREFLSSLRYFRVFIGMWNVFVILLMLTMFSS